MRAARHRGWVGWRHWCAAVRVVLAWHGPAGHRWVHLAHVWHGLLVGRRRINRRCNIIVGLLEQLDVIDFLRLVISIRSSLRDRILFLLSLTFLITAAAATEEDQAKHDTSNDSANSCFRSFGLGPRALEGVTTSAFAAFICGNLSKVIPIIIAGTCVAVIPITTIAAGVSPISVAEAAAAICKASFFYLISRVISTATLTTSFECHSSIFTARVVS